MKIIGGRFKDHQLVTPKGRETRPSSSQLREALFNICQHYISGAFFLELFAGSGAVGIEALSRGASHTTFVDRSRQCIQAIKLNLSQLDLESSSEVIHGDVFRVLNALGRRNKKYDIIFIDPPYSLKIGNKILEKLTEKELLSREGMIFLEKSSKEETFDIRNLSLVSKRKFGDSVLEQYQ